jgi:hypothetical protein
MHSDDLPTESECAQLEGILFEMQSMMNTRPVRFERKCHEHLQEAIYAVEDAVVRFRASSGFKRIGGDDET